MKIKVHQVPLKCNRIIILQYVVTLLELLLTFLLQFFSFADSHAFVSWTLIMNSHTGIYQDRVLNLQWVIQHTVDPLLTLTSCAGSLSTKETLIILKMWRGKMQTEVEPFLQSERALHPSGYEEKVPLNYIKVFNVTYFKLDRRKSYTGSI